MRIAVTGSIATDHLMTFPGRFADSARPTSSTRSRCPSSSTTSTIRRGGVGGEHRVRHGRARAAPAARRRRRRRLRRLPLLAGAGTASTPRRCTCPTSRHTARFVCTTDADQNQIASFYPGAMSEAREIELGPVAERVGGLDLVVVGAERPRGDAAPHRGVPVPRHPVRRGPVASSSRAWTATSIRQLIDGAAYLFTNEYEAALTEQKTGWIGRRGPRPGRHPRHHARRQGRQGRATRRARRPGAVPARGAQGRPHRRRRRVPRRLPRRARLGAGAERCAQVGSLLATYVIETVGTQEYELDRAGTSSSGSPRRTAPTPRRRDRAVTCDAPSAEPV